MPLKWVPVFILILGVTVIGYGLWQRHLYPPRVVSTGVFSFIDKAGTLLIFPKRVVAVAGFEKTEIQLPGGTWIDCHGDCAQAIREAHTEFWDTQMLKGK